MNAVKLPSHVAYKYKLPQVPFENTHCPSMLIFDIIKDYNCSPLMIEYFNLPFSYPEHISFCLCFIFLSFACSCPCSIFPTGLLFMYILYLQIFLCILDTHSYSTL